MSFAPAEFADNEVLRGRAAFLAIVDVAARSITVVPERVALAYHSPGCGPVDEIAAIRRVGDGLDTEVLRVDAARAAVTSFQTVERRLSFPAPSGQRTYALDGAAVIEVGAAGEVAHGTSQLADLHVDAHGILSMLQVEGDVVTAHRVGPDNTELGPVLGSAALGELRLRGGAGGRPQLVGRPQRASSAFSVVSVDGDADAVSLDGSTIVDVDAPDSASANAADAGTVARRIAVGAPGDRPVVTDVDLGSAPDVTGLVNTMSPACAVPRLDPDIQVMQPSPAQVEWAVHRAVRGQLTTSRPSNWNRSGLPAYSPQAMFPTPALSGGGRIPAQVLLGVLAQESNMWQAARGALPGVAADPLIGSYYGVVTSAGQIIGFDYDDADCGYGVGQITDHMTAADTTYSGTQKKAIALDYQVNIQVAIRILAEKWNQARAQGLIANDGDPQSVENWYFALWGYNSGIYAPSTPHPGLGWTNNPANSDYRFDRRYFLRESLDDAKRPGDWPYQERVLGFAETGLYVYGDRAFDPVQGSLVLPVADAAGHVDRFHFCTAAISCSSEHADPGPEPTSGDRSFCMDPGRYCRWQGPSTWTTVGTAEFAGAYGPTGEPGVTSVYPPSCTANASTFRVGGMTSLPASAAIVDDVADRGQNIVGCPAGASAGSFTLTYPTGSGGRRLGMIDTHQIGAGYGGHFWYSHTVDPERTHVQVVGTWTPPSSSVGWTRVMVHIPDHGADTGRAEYRIDSGTKVYTRVVNQRWNENTWIDLGIFNLSAGASVSLSNATVPGEAGGRREIDVAWDAMAFVPSAKPVVSMVAMGDSYSAGEGVEPYDSNSDVGRNTPGFLNACHRSEQAYPALAFEALKGSMGGATTFHSVACSGAVVDSINDERTRFDELPQIDQGWLDENTTHVTIGISGNDARFADVLAECVAAEFTVDPCGFDGHVIPGDDAPLAEVQADIIDGQLQRLIELVDEVKVLAPQAHIVLVGYPQIIARVAVGTCPIGTPSTINLFDTLADRLNGVIAEAATKTGASYADLASVYQNHEACAALGDEWINAVVVESDSGSGVKRPGSGSFHPKARGHQAASVEVVRALSASGSVDSAPFSDINAFIRQQYLDFFGRTPSSGELNLWRSGIQGGSVSPEDLIDFCAHDAGWASGRAKLLRLYWAFFLRKPDLGGLNYWLGRLSSGTSLATVAANYAGSPEFQNRYGSLSNRDFVAQIYRNVFEREPDTSGLNYWAGRLDTGTSRGTVMVNFSESSEGVRRLQPQVDTVLVYLGMQRSIPPAAVFDAWVGGLKSGTSLDAYIRLQRLSATYAARF